MHLISDGLHYYLSTITLKVSLFYKVLAVPVVHYFSKSDAEYYTYEWYKVHLRTNVIFKTDDDKK